MKQTKVQKNVCVTQQCQNKNLTKDDTNKVQKNVGMIQQIWNKNLTKDDKNKVQKNVSMTQQSQNKNLTKYDTNKVVFLHFYTCVNTMITPMFPPFLHLC